jgi:hypothetical protein
MRGDEKGGGDRWRWKEETDRAGEGDEKRRCDSYKGREDEGVHDKYSIDRYAVYFLLCYALSAVLHDHHLRGLTRCRRIGIPAAAAL